MDGGNRRFLVASTLLAIPAALLMVTLSGGASPVEVAQAVGTETDNTGAIQQVAGKQPQRRKTRPIGLFGVLTGSDSGTAKTTAAPSKSKSRPRGLLDGLFNQTDESTSHSGHNHSGKTTNRAQSSSSRSAPSPHNATSSSSREADWEGIPYHEVNGSSRSGSRSPIADSKTSPSQASGSTASSGTRIIRGGSSRSVQAKPVSTRRQPTLASDPSPALAIPRPAPDSERYRSTGSGSSRRSDRRSVDSLDPSEIAAASKIPSLSTANEDDTEELIPRVSRRKIETAVAAPKAKPVAKPNVAPKVAKKVAKPTEATPQLAPAPAKPASPSTALAAIAPPSESSREPEPASSADLAPRSTLSPPKPAQQYTTPVDPSRQPVPVAGIPNHPYAASTPVPSRAVAHRSGPPQDAFDSTGVANGNLSGVSAPVGSGVAAGNASYRRPASDQSYPDSDPYLPSQPQAQVTYPYQTTPYQDPPATNRLNTNGRSSAGSIDRIATRPDTVGVPMKPIAGYQAASPSAVGSDNFAPTEFDERNNRMRGDAEQAAPGMAAAASELPGLRVITNGPGEIMIRQTNQYEVRVENRGSIAAEGLLIRALVPEWAELRGQNATRGDVDTQTEGSIERLVWTIDQLPAGATERMFVRLKAEKSGTYNIDVDWTLDPQKSVAKVYVHEPKLDLSIDGPEEVVFGQSQTYKVRVLNPGDGTAANVIFTLSPNSATPQTQRIGDIPAGKEAQFEVELTAQDLGDLKIHGLASADLELRAEASKTIRVSAAKLVAMLTGPELKYQNTESMYNLQVQNSGTATSEKIVATLRLPVGVKYLGGIDDGQLRDQILRWEINALAPGATRNYQFNCNMATTGEHLFGFDCKGSAAGQADVSLATRVESIADLVLTISDPVAPAPIGTDVSYEIVVRNRGSKEATDVRAIAQFSHGIEPQRMEGHSGEVVTGQVLFDVIPRIGPGQEVKMRVIAQAEKAGHHRFRTEVRSGDTVLVAEEATHYMSPTSERVSRRSTDADNR